MKIYRKQTIIQSLWQNAIHIASYSKVITCRKADLSLCLGTTLQILPAGKLPLLAKKNENGKMVVCNLNLWVIVINKNPTTKRSSRYFPSFSIILHALVPINFLSCCTHAPLWKAGKGLGGGYFMYYYKYSVVHLIRIRIPRIFF